MVTSESEGALLLLVSFLLVNAPNCHLSLVLASVVQGDAVNCNTGLDRIQFYRMRTGLGLKNFTVRSSLLRDATSVANWHIFVPNFLFLAFFGDGWQKYFWYAIFVKFGIFSNNLFLYMCKMLN